MFSENISIFKTFKSAHQQNKHKFLFLSHVYTFTCTDSLWFICFFFLELTLRIVLWKRLFLDLKNYTHFPLHKLFIFPFSGSNNSVLWIDVRLSFCRGMTYVSMLTTSSFRITNQCLIFLSGSIRFSTI